MFPNWTGWKTVKAALFVLIAIDGWLMTVSDFGPATVQYAKLAAGLLGTIGTIVVTLSGTNAGPAVMKVGKAVVAILVFGFAARTISACALFANSSATADFGACVASDVLHGSSISAIVADCGSDVPGVIAQIVGLLGSKDAAKYVDTQAVREVRAARLTLAAAPADAGAP